MKVITKTNSIKEANQIVRDIKTPSEIKQRISLLAENLKKAKKQEDLEYSILGNLISELSAVFPRVIPQNVLLDRAKELGIENFDLIEEIFFELNNQGLVIINKNNRGQIILQFPSIPFKYKKLYVKKPRNSQEFHKESERKWKELTK